MICWSLSYSLSSCGVNKLKKYISKIFWIYLLVVIILDITYLLNYFIYSKELNIIVHGVYIMLSGLVLYELLVNKNRVFSIIALVTLPASLIIMNNDYIYFIPMIIIIILASTLQIGCIFIVYQVIAYVILALIILWNCRTGEHFRVVSPDPDYCVYMTMTDVGGAGYRTSVILEHNKGYIGRKYVIIKGGIYEAKWITPYEFELTLVESLEKPKTLFNVNDYVH